MALTLTALPQIAELAFDDIIDVRSPSEYAEDHIPGAINLPVLDDAERAEVGTIYKQDSPFRARKVGAALVAANAARHLQGALADKPGGWRPLVYCWRGGQRSGSFASILSQIGWRVELVSGGYKAYRHLVVDALYDTAFPSPVVLLGGNTGTAKTAQLHRLAARGAQMLDLEGLANHRGSLFGAMAGGQPSQKGFESRLAAAMAKLDPARVVVVEAESSKVGDCRLPPGLWKAMTAAPRLEVVAPVSARARYLVSAYGDMVQDPARLASVIASLRRAQSEEQVTDWLEMASAGAFEDLAAGLMTQHYDPRYAKHRVRLDQGVEEFETDSLDDEALERLADRLMVRLGCSNSLY
ncbi:tRNA 2-selenouridine(34) synthase MnmH (plasmid) [Pseudorhodobacter turbinis]|uniref:tRNA 2-selenouridine(34) synthase MnmH n=1 Tax=Pseudorhodobacter turbinis TaxID=2500533 RepID=A0A4V1E1B1_9RHOB|nr:tRNA 2-selenouridine(34) synthase MnmH [Pseudorhodobacter turbinis]QCO57514.1 tRNA 2-selenouridine(34) synthase MnmH [Pseudorhodobacter turbinis]